MLDNYLILLNKMFHFRHQLLGLRPATTKNTHTIKSFCTEFYQQFWHTSYDVITTITIHMTRHVTSPLFISIVGTGFSVQVTIKEANLAPLYTAVDHSRANDNDGFHGDVRITQDYCTYPVPEKYQLSLVLHQVRIFRRARETFGGV